MQIVGEHELAAETMSMWLHKDENPRLVVSGNFATPWHTLKIVDDAMSSYHLWSANFQNHEGFVLRPGVVPETVFIGPGMRGREDLRYYPLRLALTSRLFFRQTPPDIVLVHTTPADRTTGKVSLGIETNVLPAAIRACHEHGGLVITELNRAMPYTYGDAEIDVADIDFAVEWDEPLASPKHVEATPVDRQIAANLLPLIPPGAALQGGISPFIDTVLGLLAERPGAERYHVWTEMCADWAMRLWKAGLVEPPIVATFGFGSPEFYGWLDHNKFVRMSTTENVNDPGEIERLPQVVSVNTASEVDLWAQCNGAWIKGQFWSGIGGQADFVEGASRSEGGVSIIALASMHPKANVSTIVPRLCGPVTSFQPSYVVTENYAAKIQGETARQQAKNLIKAAHPLARDLLEDVLAGNYAQV